MVRTRSQKPPPKPRPKPQSKPSSVKLAFHEVMRMWLNMFYSGVLPTAIMHLFLTLIAVLTTENTYLGNKWPYILRSLKTVYMFHRIDKHGQRNVYSKVIAFGLAVSMMGDLFFMRKDQMSFNITMGSYSVMHLIFTLVLPFENFAAIGALVSAIICVLWNLLLIPILSEDYLWFIPMHTVLVCATFWRASAQSDYETYGTKTSAVMATVFFLVAHFNFSLNVFYLDSPYDYLNIGTFTLISMGQMLMGVSALDENTMFPKTSLRDI